MSAEACRAYDNAIRLFAGSLDGMEGSTYLIRIHGPDAAEKIDRAAELADGPARKALQQSALRVRLLVDAGGGGEEESAVRSSISEVHDMCHRAGAPLNNAPAPAG